MNTGSDCDLLQLSVDDIQWLLLSTELPEIIPRGVRGWKRAY